MRDGFFAHSLAEEQACPDLELNVLMSIEPVTARVQAAVAGAADAAAAGDARRAEMAKIEKECEDADQAALRRGHPLRRRRVQPLPLQEVHRRAPGVFAGGAARLLRRRPGQLQLPALRGRLRAVPGLRGRPAGGDPEHLTFKAAGPEDGRGDLRLRQPGPHRAARYRRPARVAARRAPIPPTSLTSTSSTASCSPSPVAAPSRRASPRTTSSASRTPCKALSGYLSGLLDPDLMDKKRREEGELRARVGRDPNLVAGDPWGDIERAIATERTIYPRQAALRGLNSISLPRIADTSSGWSPSGRSPTPSGCASTAKRPSPASSAGSTPRRRSTRSRGVPAGRGAARVSLPVRAGPPAGGAGLRRTHARAARPRADRRHPPRRRRRPQGAGGRGRRGRRRLRRPADPPRPRPRAGGAEAAQDRGRRGGARSKSAPAAGSPTPSLPCTARTPTPTPPSPCASPTAG